MRKPITLLVLALLAPPSLQAQQRPKLEIKNVRVGFPASVSRTEESGTRFKAGAWTPVLVEITAGKAGLTGSEGQILVSVETPDDEPVATVYQVIRPMPVLLPGESFTVMLYTKPASFLGSDQFTASVRLPDGSTVSSTKDPQALQSEQALYLLLGSDLVDLRRAVQSDDEGRKEDVAIVTTVAELPDQWFGYEGVDVVFLSTGQRDFLTALAADARRREALAQWVGRGGNLVVSVAKNQDAVAGIAELESLLPVRLAGVEQRQEINLSAIAKEGVLPGPVEIARLEAKSDRSLQQLIPPDPGDKQPLLVVQGPAGLGRVTVVGFDLDQRPFLGWQGRKEFLLSLLQHAWDRQLALAAPNDGGGFGGWNNRSNSLLADLYNDMGNFEEVPVISFGWVALFIFIYILIVGPLDYWFLKKVVKRLELTWITFPTVVILVSVIAYFTAYQIKGKDLRLRKLDLVDVDLRSQQAYGRTWLTIFSPRIDYYTIGLQPALARGDSSVTISWLGRPTGDHYGAPRGQSLFRRSYDYAPNAAGLLRVPISVWSSRSFMASWTQSLRQQPWLSAELRHPANNPGKLTGTITWQPGSTVGQFGPGDASLIYRGRVYPISLTSSEPTQVELEAKVGGVAVRDWSRGGPGSEQYMNEVLFYREQAERRNRDNRGLRELDQSWRLGDSLDEAILLLHMPIRQGAAAEVNNHPATPSRLWLGELPASNAAAPELIGILRQDTYVRVFIPISK